MELDPVFLQEKSNPWLGGGVRDISQPGKPVPAGIEAGEAGSGPRDSHLGESNWYGPQFRSFRRSRGATRPNFKQREVQGPFTRFLHSARNRATRKRALRSRAWSSKTHRCPLTQGGNDKKNTAFPPKHARGNQVHTSTRTPHPLTHTALSS